ncbi:MAG: Spy/CpxP family protein refolding chaperone [Gammaproteobacteria bacterium]|nr:Spy/CpxP family protein refolding chaperone [Gammaproteobacteria bacterium]
MKTLSKIVIGTAAGVGIALATVAYAHGPGYGPDSYGHGMGMHGSYGHGIGMHGPGGYGTGMGMYGAPGTGAPCAADARLEGIKSELKLTGSQTKAWDSFEKAVRSQTEAMFETRAQMRAGAQNPDAHITFMEQRLEGMKAVQKARTDLYKVLTPEQKAIADRYGFQGPRS